MWHCNLEALLLISTWSEWKSSPVRNVLSNTTCVGFPKWLSDKESACNAGDLGLIPGWGRSLKKEMAIHSRILAWEIPWTKEPGSSWGCKESDNLVTKQQQYWNSTCILEIESIFMKSFKVNKKQILFFSPGVTRRKPCSCLKLLT